jgi:hypothetical protein
MTNPDDPSCLNGSLVGMQTATYTVTSSVFGGNGTISPSDAISIDSGSSQSFSAAPASGYTVDVWKLDGTTVQTGGTVYALSNITSAHTLTVQFKAQAVQTYTVAASVSSGNGTISPSGSLMINSGSSQSFSAAPASGYTVDVWKLDGTTVQTGGTFYALSNITSAHTVTVQFKAQAVQTYTVTASVSSGNGIISPSGIITITSGSGQQFTASPSTGYTVNIWTLDGTTVQTGGTIYALSNVTAAHTVTVQFKSLRHLKR